MIVLTIDRPAVMKFQSRRKQNLAEPFLKISQIVLLQMLFWHKLAGELLKISENVFSHFLASVPNWVTLPCTMRSCDPTALEKLHYRKISSTVPRDRYVTLTSPPQIAYSCANIGFCAEIYKLSFPEKSPFKFLLLLRCLGKMKYFHDFLKIWKKCGQG